MPDAFIELRQATKRFAGVLALDKIDFTLNAGEIHCLAGENGSGKSTLIKLIAGVYRADGGEVRIGGRARPHLTPKEAIAAGVQVIYQDFSLFPNLKVAENLALNTLLHENRKTVAWSRVRELGRQALARLGIDIDLDAEVGSLSTAQRQLVAIARALMADVRLIIMDEPTTALTGREVDALFKIVRDIQAKGIAVLFVSHKMREMLEISERITVFRNGRKVAEGPTAEFDEASITRHMTGRDIDQSAFEWTGDTMAMPRLEVEGLAVPGIVEPTSFAIQAGEIVGLAGLLGAGRTELATALFGMRPDHEGEIRIDGVKVNPRSVEEAIEAGIAYVPEDRLTEGLFLTQSIERNFCASILDRLTRGLLLQSGQIREASLKTVDEMQVATPDVVRPVIQLSGGNAQRVLIGRWLLTGPKILILNGPTVGVDVGSKELIHKQLRALARERGLSILMISDDLPELVHNSNRILLMHKGAIVETLASASVNEDQLAAKLKALR
ncbi:monosaccharide ABC transporter ATP-binding protein, CUT2 family [Arboricoccus pini]|uniref:Monosaccharide ABC transporter ATP-binding protein, CUT2 family n=1 Tax=Arboricoccus pini TaxID=1963835 RepID=A0A212RX01_9PROT|nr:sugar ABC transporter ATP-binding protein [Arboricoccus pini]SNB77235.1 monosaccharide ABC transporter ATP-binding protein, CUT2 family [Arboricoccus pini]